MSRHNLPPEAPADMWERREKGQSLKEIGDAWDTTDQHVSLVLQRERTRRIVERFRERAA